MKVFSTVVTLSAISSTVLAFAPLSQQHQNQQQRLIHPHDGSNIVTTFGGSTSTARSMGLFDFFSDEARQAREEKKQREFEEQERLQKAIMERRRNPDKMEEYEQKVNLRRSLRMAGNDAAAEQVTIYDNETVESQTLLDGSQGLNANV